MIDGTPLPRIYWRVRYKFNDGLRIHMPRTGDDLERFVSSYEIWASNSYNDTLIAQFANGIDLFRYLRDVHCKAEARNAKI